jgi:flagellar motor switch protein FliM
MSEILSDDQIASLLDAAKQGDLPADAGPKRRPPRVQSIDFTRPTKFTSDHERRMKRALGTFCRTASTRLSAELRQPVELEVIDAAQLTWSHAHGQLAQDSLCAVVGSEGSDGRMLMAAELPFVLSAIECLLGGGPPQSRDRKLTEIDLALAEHLYSSLLNQLSVIWKDFAGVELSLVAIDNQMETAQVAPVSEPTLALTMEARIFRGSYTITLLTPHAAIAPFEDAFLAPEHGGWHGRDELTEAALRGAVSDVDVTLRAEIAGVELSLVDVLSLQVGDTLSLRSPAERGVTVCAEGVPVYCALPGRNGPRRAIQISDRLDAGS